MEYSRSIGYRPKHFANAGDDLRKQLTNNQFRVILRDVTLFAFQKETQKVLATSVSNFLQENMLTYTHFKSVSGWQTTLLVSMN